MKLDDIAKKLLDLGKRNRLLNYKDSGLKSIDVLNHNYTDIYNGLANGKTYQFLPVEPLLEEFHKTFVYEADKQDDNILEYSPLKVYDITHEACKPNQLIVYKKGYKNDKVLKALHKEYKYSITEKGINSLYISFGFVEYVEEGTKYKAPLLLIPVELSKNNNGSFIVQAADDDIILNPTLDFYFNTYYRFDIPDYEKKEDFDFDEYMNDIKAVLPESVVYVDGMSLGVYSFLKMNMYKDLMDHSDKVLENSNIQSLLGNPRGLTSEESGKVLPVVNCDSSQLKAIEMAVSGKSFVLQGPPGSGKSQTITNIIASLIGNNKHVLFVSEKLQALQVVYENLRRAGLAEFAIELHSSKANKKTFIDNLYKTAILPKYAVSNMAEDTKESYLITKKYVDSYDEALKATVDNERITVYELFSLYMGCNAEEIKIRIPEIEKHPLIEMSSVERNLREYRNAITPIGYDYRATVFYGFNEMTDAYLSYDLENEFTKSLDYIKRLKSYKDKLNSLIEFDGKNIESINDLFKVFDFITIYNNLKFDDPALFDYDKNNYLLKLTKDYLALNTTSKVLANYDKEFLNQDLSGLYRKLRGFTGAFKVFSSDYRKLKREIISYRNEKAKDNILLEELKTLIEIKNNLIEKKHLKAKVVEVLPFVNTDNIKDVSKELELINPYCGIYVKGSKEEVINKLLDELLSFKNHQENSDIYGKLATRFNGEILDFYKSSIDVIIDHLTDIYKLRDDIPSYIRALYAIAEIKKLGYLDFLNEYLTNGKPLDSIDSSFDKTIYQNKVFHEIHKNPILEGFSSHLFRERVHEFNTLDEQILKLNRDYIISINSMKRPDDVLIEGSQFKILSKEANKVRKQKPVRILLSEIYDLAVNIKPVFLMSPLSVSTYLTEDNQFDCVIFDEASQIFAEDAFGAIYRGKQCIIIGDSKQMPPSNFFGAILENPEDEDDYDAGMESILDMGNAFMPSSSLKWHYRSRSEELIAFSNKAFYDDTLITIPQAKKHTKGFGIDFVYVENGKYDMRTRTNKKEAELIAEMVVDHYKNNPSKSLGVVAFSKVQADLIEDLVEKKVYNYPEISKYFGDEVDEPFFVKNLETVQGDERDRIIFSICYGYNSDGKFFQRFGPLNNLGGERRLNVAITRSKYNITIVSSIKYTDIKDNSESIGVKLLRDYLEFAENVETEKNYSETNNGIVEALSRFLKENNYEVLANYGTSSFRIPLAIKEQDEESCLCAVMLDNKDPNRNTTDDNRLEKLLLERQGWKYYKLYSTGYIADPKSEEQKLLDFLRTEDEAIEVVEEVPTFIEETDNSLESHFENYKHFPIDKLRKLYEQKGLKYALKEMLKVEQPVNKDYFYRRAAEAMSKVKVSNVVKNEVLKNMPDDIITIGNTLWFTVNEDVTLRLESTRMLNEIPIEELKSGLYTIVSLNTGITVEGAYKALIKLLGFSRLTDNAKKLLDDCVIFLKLDGKIIQKGDCLYI